MEVKGQERIEKSGQDSVSKSKELEIKEKIEEIKEIKAGGQFLQELASKDEEKEDKKEDSKSNKDTASLSDESRYENASVKELSSLDTMWEELVNWSPSTKLSIQDQLICLCKIYEQLLQEIIFHTAGQVQENHLTELEQFLSNILIELLDTSMGELHSLFKDFGSSDSIRNMQNNLYHSVTGKFLDKRQLEHVFRETYRRKDVEKVPNIHLPSKDRENERKHGFIYEPDKHGKIKGNRQYTKRLQREEQRVGSKTTIYSIEKNRAYTPRDIELAERFAEYINHSGNLFLTSGLSGKSEELYGFLSAIMALKTQSFLAIAEIDEGLSFDLREAMENQIDYYIQKETTGKTARSFQPKTAYKIFYYMMNLYKKTEDLEETVNKGLRHAYRKYLSKQQYEKEEDTGSFFSKEISDEVENWKEGKRILEEDYKRYYAFLVREDLGGYYPEVLLYSPWGMFAEPHQSQDRRETPKPVVFGVISALLLVSILIIYFLFL